MSETIVDAAQAAENDAAFDPVCLDVPRIYDSCGAKDCLRDLTVFFTQENQELINTATTVRVTRVSVLTATVDVDAMAFNRGYYSVDETYYFLCCCEVFTAAGALPATVMGIAVSTKRVVLYGSDGSAKRFSSNTPAVIDPTEADCCQGFGGSLPVANVQVSAPMALAASLVPVTTPPIVSFVPENVTTFIGGDLVAPDTQQVTVTARCSSCSRPTISACRARSATTATRIRVRRSAKLNSPQNRSFRKAQAKIIRKTKKDRLTRAGLRLFLKRK